MQNKILIAGALLGLLSVLMAAYIDHSLSFSLANKSLQSLLTANRYHQLYAIIIASIGLFVSGRANKNLNRWPKWSACFFIMGIFFFSFNIYSYYLFKVNMLILVPVGGICFMLGWCGLVLAGLSRKSQTIS